MVISAIWSILAGQNRGPYIRNSVYMLRADDRDAVLYYAAPSLPWDKGILSTMEKTGFPVCLGTRVEKEQRNIGRLHACRCLCSEGGSNPCAWQHKILCCPQDARSAARLGKRGTEGWFLKKVFGENLIAVLRRTANFPGDLWENCSVVLRRTTAKNRWWFLK